MRAGDVVVDIQRFADADGDGFFAAVEMRQAGHERAGVEFVDLLLEMADPHHLAVGAQPLVFGGGFSSRLLIGGCGGHFLGPPMVTGVETPDMAASTSNMQAKSYFVQPMPRAAVRISLLTAVVGKGTSSCRPRSMARTISFCIMLTSNQASSGCCRTKGPRYFTMGE